MPVVGITPLWPWERRLTLILKKDNLCDVEQEFSKFWYYGHTKSLTIISAATQIVKCGHQAVTEILETN